MSRVRVAVTGAAGQIGYSLLFRLASGEVFGDNVTVDLSLLELPQGVKAAEGTAMELADCAFKTLGTVDCYDSADAAFDGASWVLMVGSQPRGPGMERSDLIKANGPIFINQGKALLRADNSVRAIVVGNPCNTNALIAWRNAQDLPASRVTAMTALDENRAKAQLAGKAGVPVGSVTNMTIWGNHSTTMHPDFEAAKIGGKPATDVVTDRSWLENEFIPVVQKRGAAIIEARGKSSAASAASACLDHVRWLTRPTPAGDTFSAAVISDGNPYGVPEGLMYSFPLTSDGSGDAKIKAGIAISDYARAKLDATAAELAKEREFVADCLP